MTEPKVLVEQKGVLGVITLNRPKALNALDTDMVEQLLSQYKQWNEDEEIRCILLKGAGPKAFCAGGDVKGVALRIKEGVFHAALHFFRTEYTLNHALSVLSKPAVAVLDGIVMGGGAGVSMHGPFRVATDRSMFAMPECGIGLFPDVGASRFLTRLPGELGTYLGLTGARLQGADLKRCGLATHFIPSDNLSSAEAALQQLGPRARAVGAVDQTLKTFETHVRPAEGIMRRLPDINQCFAADSVEEIRQNLDSKGTEWAREATAALDKGSPLSQKVTLRALRQGRGAPLTRCLQMENRIVTHMIRGPSDFYEGVRATLIDRDSKPRWHSTSLPEVTPDMVDAFFALLPQDEELQLPPSSASQSARL